MPSRRYWPTNPTSSFCLLPSYFCPRSPRVTARSTDRWRLALDVFRTVDSLIREPLMKGISFPVFLAASLTVLLFPRQVAAVRVTLILQNIVLQNVAVCDFDEWKVTSKQQCTQCSGKIVRDTDAFEQTWYVGDPGNDIRFWWSRLSG